MLPLASSGTVPWACPPGASPHLPPGPTCPSRLCSGHTLSSNRQWLWGAQSLPQNQPGRIWAWQPRRPPSPTTRPPLLTWEFTCRNPIYLTSWREPPKPGSAQRGAAQLPPIALLQTQPGCGPTASACAHVPSPPLKIRGVTTLPLQTILLFDAQHGPRLRRAPVPGRLQSPVTLPAPWAGHCCGVTWDLGPEHVDE